MTTGAFRHALRVSPPDERFRLIGTLMREARDSDVWHFVTPAEVSAHWDDIRPYLGRRRAFWQYLFDGWRRDGFLS